MNAIRESVHRAAPYAHDRSSVDRIMLQVCLALTPATLFGFYLFGLPAILTFVSICLAAIATEAICLLLQGQSISRLRDASALLTGWLLAMSMPPWCPWWLCLGAGFFAIAIGKHLYGGIGQNVFNPAMLARVALLISFPVQMTTWVQVTPLGSEQAPGLLQSLAIFFEQQSIPDGYTGATLLGAAKAAANGGSAISELVADNYSLTQSFLGNTLGSLGETSELLILLGGLWLLRRRIISWHIPVAMLGSTLLLSGLFYMVSHAQYLSPWYHLTSGGVMLGAFFIATDYVTSPSSTAGKLIFGAGCGLVMYVIRAWGGFPEAVGFAVLFMNALTPLIDRVVKPRAYGRDQRGNPIKNVSARKAS
ncbi:RnfABCDGE type electron transport complex subunit D [Ketobacter sp.]|uniref:RnfABCDGE type electron transport complex subunit D n=1 Tax=Ketobacter sp. TaxID=2083498 RepID=UPI000F0E1383|nr:RnfABCDGE type electron transport complex subunit D [Ketobacter sp.]RLU02046.1 MAG: RnfABCDGE type electron transport complex subunit D [Ketobacter sp.]